jgi:hypothetical protein
MLSFGRYELGGDPNYLLRLIADVDGNVHVALLIAGTSAQVCGLIPTGFTEGKYAFNITRMGPTGQGMLAGSVDSLHPSIVEALPDDKPADFNVSSQWLLRMNIGPITALSWDGQSEALVYDPAKDPDHLPGFESVLVAGDVFFDVNVGGLSGTMAWNQSVGLQPLLRWYGNPDKASGNFGTDGKDMVWTYGEGKLPGGYKYTKLSVMTAPYTLDPAKAALTSRRLRSDPTTFFPIKYAVGCGYAARMETTDTEGNYVLVVRLTDGVSWKLMPKDPMSYPVGAVGLTCDELFFEDPTQRVGRVRLDSLGPGIPPD